MKKSKGGWTMRRLITLVTVMLGLLVGGALVALASVPSAFCHVTDGVFTDCDSNPLNGIEEWSDILGTSFPDSVLYADQADLNAKSQPGSPTDTLMLMYDEVSRQFRLRPGESIHVQFTTVEDTPTGPTLEIYDVDIGIGGITSLKINGVSADPAAEGVAGAVGFGFSTHSPFPHVMAEFQIALEAAGGGSYSPDPAFWNSSAPVPIDPNDPRCRFFDFNFDCPTEQRVTTAAVIKANTDGTTVVTPRDPSQPTPSLCARIGAIVDFRVPPTGAYKNHGAYVNKVAKVATSLVSSLVAARIISPGQGVELQGCVVSPRAIGSTTTSTQCRVFPGSHLWSVHFLDAPNANKGAFVGADATLCLTNDGGQSWQSPDTVPGFPSDPTFYDVQFADPSHGWVVGDEGIILATANGGKDWVAQNSTTNATLRAVYFADANNGWAVGPGIILKTTNGGGTWGLPTTSPLGLTPYDISCVSASNCVIVGSGGGGIPIATTVDGGGIWNLALVAKDTNAQYPTFFGVHFSPPDSTVAVGVDSSGEGAIRFGSTTATAWLLYDYCGCLSPFGNPGWSDVDCVGSTCWAVGAGGGIIHSTGFTGPPFDWGSQASHRTSTLHHVHFINATTGWVVGDFATLLKTTNGGADWLAVTLFCNTNKIPCPL